MSFIDSMLEDDLIYEEEYQYYYVKAWFYYNQTSNRDFKLKSWTPKYEVQNEFVKEIWLNESRQLRKLKSVTNADKYLELIHDSFIDNGVYCLVYPADENVLSLLDFIEEKKAKALPRTRRISLKSENKHWLLDLKNLTIHSRIIFWKNIQRLITGIEILHQQDIIHRNININSIMYNDSTDREEDERFILSGFEKSVDFNKSASIPIFDENTGLICTTHQDWKDLSKLILKLMDIDENNYQSTKLSKIEISIIEQLQCGVSQGNLTSITNINTIKKLIIKLISNLSDVDFTVLPKFYITTGRSDSTVFQRIREDMRSYLSENPISEYSSNALTDMDVYNFLKEDLDLDTIRVFRARNNHYLIQGKNLLYSFNSFKSDRFPNWGIAYINNITSPPNWLNSAEKLDFKGKLVFAKDVFTIKNDLSDENSWQLKLLQLEKTTKFTEDEMECLQGLLVSFAVDVAEMESKKYLIRIDVVDEEDIKKQANLFTEKGINYFTIEFREEDNVENTIISHALSLQKPSDRFKRCFDENKLEEFWIIEPKKSNKDIENGERKKITFIGELNGQYIFSSVDNLDIELSNFATDIFRIYSSDLEGDQAQIKRRIRSFETLMDHASLLVSLADPAGNFFVSSRDFEVEDILKNFDNSKKEVFNSLIKTNPNYFIEGPPGVGKTFLITNYVRHLFEEESSAKVLLSAQAHATVKILYDGVLNSLRDLSCYDDLIVIEAFNDGKQSKKEDGDIVFETTKPFIESFKQSDMFKRNYKDSGIKKKLDKFIKNPDRSFFKYILRSANLVFTTSNSGLMSNLVQDDINFDVSIMEEAAKASGLELISPMMAANKRVMIGDYKQLPAFSEQLMEKIINKPDSFDVDLVLGLLEDNGLRNVIRYDIGLKRGLIDKDTKIKILNNMKRYFSLFRSLSIDAKHILNNRQPSFGNMLNIQHRMHPDIANIVSTTVYNGELKNHPEKVEHFSSHSPFYFKESNLKGLNSDNAIIWVDLPDKQSKLGMKSFEKKYVNQQEIKIIIELLSKLTTDFDEKYSLKVLSPYSKQVAMINMQINLSSIDDCFSSNLNQELASTVDSFQGNEADVIVISMVRHNSFTPINSALGFLSDMRRMNVLLSRAKYKMIIVGCFGLFRRWQELETEERDNSRRYLSEENKEFLDRLVDYCQSDFEILLNDDIPTNEKAYTNVNFVSATEFLKD